MISRNMKLKFSDEVGVGEPGMDDQMLIKLVMIKKHYLVHHFIFILKSLLAKC